jgi:DNA (cytosine-5)-methyltransferase 1
VAAYYNEHDPGAAAWLRELIRRELIADGVVDGRSIADVQPNDLVGFTQCHFFAGIGGWSYALRIAGWPDDRPVWTGSCPCQPFSSAGRGDGAADPRHLWPTWFQLIRERRPHTICCEQVASKAALGWFDLVSADLEGEGYAVGAVDLGAASVGAPHIRQRLWFVAESEAEQHDGRGPARRGRSEPANGGGVGQPDSGGPQARRERQRDEDRERRGSGTSPTGVQGTDGQRQRVWPDVGQSDDDAGFWSDCDWIPCRDGKARPVEPGTFPLAHRVPARVGRLRGYGNAIVPQVAAEVVRAYMDIATGAGRIEA